jgi:hypothetical protein
MFGLYAIVAQIVLQIVKGQQLKTAFDWAEHDGGILGDKNGGGGSGNNSTALMNAALLRKQANPTGR